MKRFKSFSILILVFIFLFSLTLFNGTSYSATVRRNLYFARNSSKKNLNLLDFHAKNKNISLFSFNGCYVEETDKNNALTKYFMDKGYNNIMLDINNIDALLLTKYINTKNEDIIKDIKIEEYNKVYLNYLLKLKSTSTKKQEINIIGSKDFLNTDIINFTLLPKYLGTGLPSKNIKSNIDKWMDIQNQINDNKDFFNFIETLNKDLGKNKTSYKVFFGEYYEPIKNIISYLSEELSLYNKNINLQQKTIDNLHKKYFTNTIKRSIKKGNKLFIPINKIQDPNLYSFYKNALDEDFDLKNVYFSGTFIDESSSKLPFALKCSKGTELIRLHGYGSKYMDYEFSYIFHKDKLNLSPLYNNLPKAELKDFKNLDFSELDKYDKLLSKYSIYLTGEVHGIAESKDIKLGFLKFLNQKYGVKYLLLEFSYSEGQLINNYLSTGNENILKTVFNNFKGTEAYIKEDYDYFIKLYNYNKSISEDKRIKVIGIDIEHQQNTALSYVKSLIPGGEIPASLKEVKDNVNKLSTNNISINEALQDALNLNDSSKKYLGDNYFDLIFTLKNMETAFEYYKTKDGAIRENGLFSNFETLKNFYKNEKFYGEFGDAHITEVGGYDYIDETFVEKIKKNDKDYENILTIHPLYVNSYFNNLGKTEKIINSNESYSFKTYSFIAKGQCTIFPINTYAGYDINKTPYGFVMILKNVKAATTY